MEAFTKIIRPGSVSNGPKNDPLYVRITWEQRPGSMVLTFSGVIGPRKGGDAVACGQVTSELACIDHFAKGWTPGMVTGLAWAWERWHLNDMRAGAPDQEEALREHKAKGWKPAPGFNHYTETCALLKKLGLLFSKSTEMITLLGRPGKRVAEGYQYGTSWVLEEVPEEVLIALMTLPDADKQPAWI